MRIIPILAAMLAFTGVSVAVPAAAETTLTKSTPVGVSTNVPAASGTSADQYRDRREWRGNRNWRGNRSWRGNRGWRGHARYRRGYVYRPYRAWSRPRVVCRYRYGHRRCYRVY